MMTVKVLYFASLREMLGKAEDTIVLEKPVQALSVWQSLNPEVSLPDACLIAVNQEYASSGSNIKAGDELAFFPPVTGG